MKERTSAELAVALWQSPVLAKSMRLLPVPSDILDLIKIAADSDTPAKIVPEKFAERSAVAREAAVLYIQQVLFQREDDFGLLGLAPGAPLAKIQEHKRWLLKWLHPDRNHNQWEQVYFNRVQEAAKRLENNVGSTAALPARLHRTGPGHAHKARRIHAQNRRRAGNLSGRIISRLIQLTKGIFIATVLAVLYYVLRPLLF